MNDDDACQQEGPLRQQVRTESERTDYLQRQRGQEDGAAILSRFHRSENESENQSLGAVQFQQQSVMRHALGEEEQRQENARELDEA